MKRVLFLLGTFLFFFYGCVDDHNEILSDDLQPLDLNLSRAGGDGKYDLLGYGYDVTGEFYHPNSSRSPVIDIQKFYQENAGRVVENTSGLGDRTWYIGSNATEYLSKLTVKMNAKYKGLLFGATLNTSYSLNDSCSAKYSFASYNEDICRKQIFLNAGVELLQQYLTSEFLEDIQNQSAEYIVKFYGTHVLTNITLGGRLQLIYRSVIKEENKETIVKAGASARVKSIFRLNISGDYQTSDVVKNTEEMISYKTIGGDPSKALINTINVSDVSSAGIDLSSWQASVDDSNMALIYSAPNTMIPIYDLVVDPVKKERLKAAVEQYLKSKTFVIEYERVPLYRYVTTGKKLDLDHFYTTDFNELGYGGPGPVSQTYRYEKIECYVYPVWCKPENAVPLYRYGSIATNLDHFYCTDWNELGYGPGPNKIKYKFESIECYVCSVNDYPTNSVPLYRYGTYGKDLDHFYTIDWNEIRDGKADGYNFESIECYVFKTARD